MKNGIKHLQTFGRFILLLGKTALLITWLLTRVLETLLRIFNALMGAIFKK